MQRPLKPGNPHPSFFLLVSTLKKFLKYDSRFRLLAMAVSRAIANFSGNSALINCTRTTGTTDNRKSLAPFGPLFYGPDDI